MKINLLVIDIAEQSEIIDFTQEALEKLSIKFPKLELCLQSFQLNSKQLERDFDFTPIKIEDQIHLALFHTKIFKTVNGEFLEASWWIKFMQSVFNGGHICACLYSGDITEFKQWYDLMRSNSSFQPERLQLLDVFDLLYPPKYDSFESWLETELAMVIKSLKSDA